MVIPVYRTLRLLAVVSFVWISGSVAPGKLPAQTASFERAPINYHDAEVNDRVAQLDRRIESGEVSLRHDPQFGYLPSLLEQLDVPVSSQTLVFSKTSLQIRRITPRHPRALYFNDDVYVGYCHRGDVIEVAASDAKQGAIFYSLDQSAGEPPRFKRDRGVCLGCHVSHRTQKVPGYLMRSVFAGSTGQPQFRLGSFDTDSTSDFRQRWGGWYVSGTHGQMRHMGNTMVDEDEPFDFESGANLVDLSAQVNTRRYLTPHSDIVALLVLQHQSQMHNAFAAANYETRMALHQSFKMNKLLDRPEGFISDSANRRINASVDRLLEHLLMCDEFTLTDKVKGTSSFARDFQSRGSKDSQDRSLRDLDLETRVFKYPCSFLIHSPVFDSLPNELRQRVVIRLRSILGQGSSEPQYAHLTSNLRREIVEILSDTKPGLL